MTKSLCRDRLWAPRGLANLAFATLLQANAPASFPELAWAYTELAPTRFVVPDLSPSLHEHSGGPWPAMACSPHSRHGLGARHPDLARRAQRCPPLRKHPLCPMWTESHAFSGAGEAATGRDQDRPLHCHVHAGHRASLPLSMLLSLLFVEISVKR